MTQRPHFIYTPAECREPEESIRSSLVFDLEASRRSLVEINKSGHTLKNETVLKFIDKLIDRTYDIVYWSKGEGQSLESELIGPAEVYDVIEDLFVKDDEHGGSKRKLMEDYYDFIQCKKAKEENERKMTEAKQEPNIVN